jgi:hypothetical protein
MSTLGHARNAGGYAISRLKSLSALARLICGNAHKNFYDGL